MTKFYGSFRTLRSSLHCSLSYRLRLPVVLACLTLVFLTLAQLSAIQAAYWQTPAAFATVSAASFEANLTPEGIAAGFGSNLAPANATATTTPLPTVLNGVSVTVNGRNAGLFFVSSGQINYLVPPETAAGEATVNVLRNGTVTHSGKLNIRTASPAIFSANANGIGVPAAVALRVAGNSAQSFETIAQFVNNRWTTKAVDLGATSDKVFLLLFACGLRGLPNTDGSNSNGVAENVRVLLGGSEIVPSFAGPQGTLAGIDQLNVEVPRSLIGRGKVKLSVLANSFLSNEVEIEIAGFSNANSPIVKSFAPTLVTAGDTLNVNGNNFNPTAPNNTVIVGGTESRSVEAALPTQLSARVPFGAESGNVTVRTAFGDGTGGGTLAIRTSVSGIVTDTQQQPLVGARVRIIGTTINDLVRADGSFVLKDVPTGTRGLEIDPTSLPLMPPPPKYQTLVGLSPNRDTHLGQIRLQVGNGDGALSTQSQTGFANGLVAATNALTAPAGQVTAGGVTFSLPDNAVATFPADQPGNTVYLTVVANSRTPSELPAGVFSSAIVQLTPFGVKFNPGGKFTFPNSDGLAANATARLYKLDQTANSATLGQFVEVGTATVSADGQRIETAANAISETSMYLVAVPRPVTTVVGRVLDSDGNVPVRRAHVFVRGQESFTDGDGAFVVRNVPIPTNNLLSVEVSFERPTGRTDRVTRDNIAVAATGLTRVTPDLVLPSPQTQANRPPALLAPLALSVTEGQTLTVPLIVNDPDPLDTVQVSVSGATFAAITTAQAGFQLQLTPGGGTAGKYALTLRATDSRNASTQQTVAVTVRTSSTNRPPVLTVPGTQTVAENQALSFGVSATDADTNQTLTFSATNVPSGASFNAATRQFTWTPGSGQAGSYTVTFTVTDNGTPSLSDSKNVTITVLPNTGTLIGTVRNAATGANLPGATLAITGTNLSTTSGSDGSYTLNNVPAGTRTLTASATGFSSTQLTLTINAGQPLTQNISLSPVLTTGQLRITLNWTKDTNGAPVDLDAHLTGPTAANGCFEVYFGNQGSLAESPFSLLEVDNIDLEGAPPTETIRIAQRTPGTYRFYVVNFSGEAANGLSLARTTVQIFGDSGLIRSFTVPTGTGRFWTVFELNGQTGALTDINQLSDAPPSLTCGGAGQAFTADTTAGEAPVACSPMPEGLTFWSRGHALNSELTSGEAEAQGLTTLLWFKRNAIPADWFSLSDSAGRSTLFSSGSLEQPSFKLQFGDGSAATVAGTSWLPFNEWVQLALTWESSTGRLLLYRNGVLESVATGGLGQSLRASPLDAAQFGARTSFDKQFGDVQIFNRALTQLEISGLLRANATGVCR